MKVPSARGWSDALATWVSAQHASKEEFLSEFEQLRPSVATKGQGKEPMRGGPVRSRVRLSPYLATTIAQSPPLLLPAELPGSQSFAGSVSDRLPLPELHGAFGCNGALNAGALNAPATAHANSMAMTFRHFEVIPPPSDAVPLERWSTPPPAASGTIVPIERGRTKYGLWDHTIGEARSGKDSRSRSRSRSPRHEPSGR
jgi:hypothetical protein